MDTEVIIGVVMVVIAVVAVSLVFVFRGYLPQTQTNRCSKQPDIAKLLAADPTLKFVDYGTVCESLCPPGFIDSGHRTCTKPAEKENVPCPGGFTDNGATCSKGVFQWA